MQFYLQKWAGAVAKFAIDLRSCSNDFRFAAIDNGADYNHRLYQRHSR